MMAQVLNSISIVPQVWAFSCGRSVTPVEMWGKNWEKRKKERNLAHNLHVLSFMAGCLPELFAFETFLHSC